MNVPVVQNEMKSIREVIYPLTFTFLLPGIFPGPHLLPILNHLPWGIANIKRIVPTTTTSNPSPVYPLTPPRVETRPIHPCYTSLPNFCTLQDPGLSNVDAVRPWVGLTTHPYTARTQDPNVDNCSLSEPLCGEHRSIPEGWTHSNHELTNLQKRAGMYAQVPPGPRGASRPLRKAPSLVQAE